MKKIVKVILFTFSSIIGISTLLYLTSSGNYSVPETIATNTNLPGIQLNAYTFHGETFGNPQSEPILILHGGPGADYKYLYSLKPLSSHFYLIFFDQRGTGLSPRVPTSEITLDKYLEDIDAFVEAYGKGKPIYLLGHSWGAMLAAAYAERYPQKIKGLILAEPGPLKKAETNTKSQGPPMKVLLKAGWAFLQSMHIDKKQDLDAPMDYVFNAMMEGMDSELFHVKNPLERWRGGYTVFNQLVLAAAQNPNAENMLHISQHKEKFKKEVLFICGENSPLSGPSFQQENMKLFLKPRLVIIKDASHYMLNENPRDSILEIKSYINRK